MHLQNLKKRATPAPIVAARATHQEGVQADQMITGREPRSTPRDPQNCRAGNAGSKNHIFNQNRDAHHHTRFDERFSRQYSPNYNDFQMSPLGFIPGQDLSATLIELANIQSRPLEMMTASQRSQQEAFNELTKASKDKANDAMFASIKTYDGRN